MFVDCCNKNSPFFRGPKGPNNNVLEESYGGYHLSYEVKKLMYEKICSLFNCFNISNIPSHFVVKSFALNSQVFNVFLTNNKIGK